MQNQIEPGVYYIGKDGEFMSGFHGYEPSYIQITESGIVCILGRRFGMQQFRNEDNSNPPVPEGAEDVIPVRDEKGYLLLPPSNWRDILGKKATSLPSYVKLL